MNRNFLINSRPVILTLFMPLVMLRQFIHFLGFNMGPISISLPFLLLGACMAFVAMSGCVRNSFFRLFSCFILYGLLSGGLYVFSDIPIRAFLLDVCNFIFPMFFYFIGADERNVGNHFERSFVWSCVACFLIGFYFYFSMSSWYIAHMKAMHAKSIRALWDSESSVATYLRFTSFWSVSYAISYFGMSSLCWAYQLLAFEKPGRGRRFALAAIIVSWLACILCQQRAAMFASSLVLVALFGVESFFTRRMALFKNVFVALTLLVVTLHAGQQLFPSRFEYLQKRIAERTENIDYSQAMSERSGQYAKAMAAWNSVLWGYGLGSGNAYAYTQGFVAVPDGNYVKMLYEQGLIGLIWFALILGCSLTRGLRHFRLYRFEVCVLCCYCIAAVGSSAFCNGSGLYALPLWYSVGRIWNNNERNLRQSILTGGNIA